MAEDYRAEPFEDGLGGSLPLANHRWEISLNYGLRGEVWEGYGGISYSEKSYPNFLLPDNLLREDQVLSLKSGAEWRLGDEFQIFVELEWLDNLSTLGESASINKNYNQTVVYLGGRWTTEN